MKWRREHTGHYSRVSTDEYAINPDPVPPPRILVSPSGVSCSYPRFVYISPGRIYVWSPAPSLVLSFDDRSRVCSQLQLQFPGSLAPERSPANSPPSLSLSLILFALNACLLSLFLLLFNACLLCRALSLQRTPALSFSLRLTCAFSLFLFLFKARHPPFLFLYHFNVYLRAPSYLRVAQVCAHTCETCRTSPWRHVKDPPWTRDRPDFRVRLPYRERAPRRRFIKCSPARRSYFSRMRCSVHTEGT